MPEGQENAHISQVGIDQSFKTKNKSDVVHDKGCERKREIAKQGVYSTTSVIELRSGPGCERSVKIK